MRYKLSRAVDIYREEGSLKLARKLLQYAPIEVNNFFYTMRRPEPTRVMDEDWDTLLIFDACRYDLFEEALEGRCLQESHLESRISLGSTSEEFLEKNFAGETFHDTVYVNTNPYLPRTGLDDGTFHAVVDLLEEWDDETQTVLPSTVVEAAIDAYQQFPEKRLIVHFMQPHYPFIGHSGFANRGWRPSSGTDLVGESVWTALRNGNVDASISEVWEAYRDNLDRVLDASQKLLSTVDGRTIITADHGNLVGERLSPIPTRPKFGHPLGVYHPALVKVPWFVVPGQSRRKITSEPPVDLNSPSQDVTESRLKALGYK